MILHRLRQIRKYALEIIHSLIHSYIRALKLPGAVVVLIDRGIDDVKGAEEGGRA